MLASVFYGLLLNPSEKKCFLQLSEAYVSSDILACPPERAPWRPTDAST
jgi:hypothetical protein